MLRPLAVAAALVSLAAACFAAGVAVIAALGLDGWRGVVATWAVILVALAPVAAGIVLAARRIDRRWSLRMVLAGIVLFAAAVVLHNVISGLTGVEEPVFFALAVLVAPLVLLTGLAGLLAPRLRAFRRRDPGTPRPPGATPRPA
ncbi:MAG TPA: hypothetical protein VFC53_08320 [Dehalococcoidia bacterium]|nr:hypothetical protein [Dehalococcoidia bacterium]